MNELELIGAFISIAITLVGGLAMVVRPMNSLTKSITELNDNFRWLKENNLVQDKKLEMHEDRLDHHDVKLAELDVRTNRLESEHQRVHWDGKE